MTAIVGLPSTQRKSSRLTQTQLIGDTIAMVDLELNSGGDADARMWLARWVRKRNGCALKFLWKRGLIT